MQISDITRLLENLPAVEGLSIMFEGATDNAWAYQWQVSNRHDGLVRVDFHAWGTLADGSISTHLSTSRSRYLWEAQVAYWIISRVAEIAGNDN